MVMRYHWGLAVGHTYAHERENIESMEIHPVDHGDIEEASINSEVEEDEDNPDGTNSQEDSAEHTLENRDDDQWDNSSASEADDFGPDGLGISDVEGGVSDDEFVFLGCPRFGPRSNNTPRFPRSER
jgi:hypothetical protein